MKANSFRSVSPATRDSLSRRIARVLLPVISATITLQPLAYAAPSTTLLSQVPKFVDQTVESNVVFLMDDSKSMEDIRLPVPPQFTPGSGGDVSVRGRATGFSNGVWTVAALSGPVSRDNEWIYRTSALNPLYYNPAITYKPWNDNGREGAAGTYFENALYGPQASDVTDPATQFRFGLTEQDKRFRGPNYSFERSGSFADARLSTVAGANPPPVPSYICGNLANDPTLDPDPDYLPSENVLFCRNRPVNGGFYGQNDGSRNADLYTSRMVRVVGGSQQCTVTPTNPTTSALPSINRDSVLRPTTNRTTETRQSTALPTAPRSQFARDPFTRPATNRLNPRTPTTAPTSAPATVTTRTETPPTVSSRLTPRPTVAATTTTNRTLSTRPSTTPVGTTNRSSAPRASTVLQSPTNRSVVAKEWRYETGVCGSGNYSTWSTTLPGTRFCSNPNGEGASLAQTQSRCPSASSEDPNNANQCLSDCPSGSTASGMQCVYSCLSGTTLINGRCYSACGGTTPAYPPGEDASNATQCLSACPANTTPNATQCVGGCPANTNLIGGQCYSACAAAYPSGQDATNATQCLSACPANTTPTATQCLGQCPGGSNPIGGLCYSACTTYPSGQNATNATQCLNSCPTGANTTATTCEACAAGSTIFPGSPSVCRANCPTGTGLGQTATQCLACTSGTPNTTTAQCTGICPTGSTLVGSQCLLNCVSPAVVYGTDPTQCQSPCPTGTGLGQNDTQCLGACPATHPNLRVTATSTTCYAACPSVNVTVQPAGTTVSVTTAVVGTNNDANFAQCRSNCPTSPAMTAVNATQCQGTCATNTNLISGQCYGACQTSGFAIDGDPASVTQCRLSCPTGTGLGQTATQCLGACPATHPTVNSAAPTTCLAGCPTTHPTEGPLGPPAQCIGPCATGTQVGNQCLACPSGNTVLPSGQCCPSVSVTTGNCPINRPSGFSCTAGLWVPDLDKPAPARYYVFAPATTNANPTASDLSNPANYVRVEINRDKQHQYQNFVGRHGKDKNGDGVVSAAELEPGQCIPGDLCSWEAEAQNFANWYTYYRFRLASAIGVTAASMSRLTNESGLDRLRLGYGSINNYASGPDPYSTTGATILNTDIDGISSSGAIVRGVRPFTEKIDSLTQKPPSNATLNADKDPRQEVFNWLFSLRAIGATPNREAIDSVGRYFSSKSNRGPWISPTAYDPKTPSTWSSQEAELEHISCRRNYSILVTDGEWTNQPPPQQRIIEEMKPATPLNALTSTVPTDPHAGRPLTAPGVLQQWVPSENPQFSNNATGITGTLTDVALHYWATDLRTDLPNSVIPPDPPPVDRLYNPAYWQHMSTYIVGYGLTASRDTAGNRQTILDSSKRETPSASRQAVDWPSVKMDTLLLTDSDAACKNVDGSGNDLTKGAGCGRVDDTFRAALASRGNFLTATDIGQLADGVKNAFEDINEVDGIGSALAGRSGTLRAGDRLFVGGFRTVVWSGRIQSFDAVDYFNGLASTPPSTPVSYDSRFPAAASRNILTSTARNTAVVVPTSSLTGLSAEQVAALNNDPSLLRWVRGDQSTEARNSANGFRNRRNGDIMGTVVNSQPIYSKAPDSGYKTRKPTAAAASPTSGTGSYADFVKLNEQHRPARVYVNTNGGMLHAFDARGGPLTNTTYMNEVFAYIPRAAYPRFPSLASPGYVHRYLVDGPVVEGDVYINIGGVRQWRNVIVGTTGAGPKGVFALDVTQRNGINPQPMEASNVLFDIAGTDDDPVSTTDPLSDLGHILQPGVIGSGVDGNWYYFVGNGYESQNDKARLLAIRIPDGEVTVIETDNAGGPSPNSGTVSNRPNGLGGVTPLYNQNRDIVAIYAGDRLGRMWRFDLSGNSASAWKATPATKLFEAVSPSPSGQPQAITAAPRVMQHPLGGRILIFGTGKVFEEADLTDVTTVHSVYGIREGTAAAPTVPAGAIKSDLLQLTLGDKTDSTTGARFRQLTGVPAESSGGFPWTGANAKRGWYFDLRTSSARGERVVQAPVENFGFANITTYEPSEDGNPCLGGGQSFFYRLDIARSFTRPPFQNTGPISNLINDKINPIPANTLIGSALEAGTISRLEQLVIPAIATTSTSLSLTGAQTAGLADRTASASTNPCAAARVGGQGVRRTALTGPLLNCPVTPLRVWRELPRNPR